MTRGQLVAELDARERRAEFERLVASLQKLHSELRLHDQNQPRRTTEAAADLVIAVSQAELTARVFKT